MKNEEVKKVNEILVKGLKDLFPEHKFFIDSRGKYNEKTNKRETFIVFYASIPVKPYVDFRGDDYIEVRAKDCFSITLQYGAENLKTVNIFYPSEVLRKISTESFNNLEDALKSILKIRKKELKKQA